MPEGEILCSPNPQPLNFFRASSPDRRGLCLAHLGVPRRTSPRQGPAQGTFGIYPGETHEDKCSRNGGGSRRSPHRSQPLQQQRRKTLIGQTPIHPSKPILNGPHSGECLQHYQGELAVGSYSICPAAYAFIIYTSVSSIRSGTP